jgi:predicted nucleotide-binding protein (sugar kinase/HSP70/actin superfamily)
MYATEYRKALRDAGFDGFRVLLFEDNGGLSQASGEERGLDLTPKFFISVLKAILVGDILNVMGYRMRPYEIVGGSTDEAITKCKRIMFDCFAERRNTLRALRVCRKILQQVEVNRLQPKPKVTVIGEFWAMTTEGDGNYRLQRFLEGEGAEVESTMLMSWLLYQTWQIRWDTKQRMMLRAHDQSSRGLVGADSCRRICLAHDLCAVLQGAGPEALSPARHERDRDDLASALRQSSARRRRSYGGRQSNSDRSAPQSAHGSER